MNEKILQVVGIILEKPSIDCIIAIKRYAQFFEIMLKPRTGWFTNDFMQEVVKTFPINMVYVQENDDFGLHLSITMNEECEINPKINLQ